MQVQEKNSGQTILSTEHINSIYSLRGKGVNKFMQAIKRALKERFPIAYSRAGYLATWLNIRHYIENRMRTPNSQLPPRYFLSQCIRVKNEARFLPELLAHHLACGVEHIYIYNNNSSDDIEDALMPFALAGMVTLIDWPKRPASPSCYSHFLAHFGNDSRWVAFTDADEFICETRKGALLEMLEAHERRCALALNWRYFGSSGHVKIPDGLISEQFNQCAPSYDSHVKVIAQPRKISRYYNSHNFYYRRFSTAISNDGHEVLGSRVEPSKSSEVYIRHYVYRATEDYIRKTAAGFVDASGASDRARRAEFVNREFNRHNDEFFPMHHHHLSGTRAVLGALIKKTVTQKS